MFKSDYYRLFCFDRFCFICVVCLFWWLYGFRWWVFAIEKLEYSRYNTKTKYQLVWHNTYSSGLLSYTNGSHKGFVEFCVIEVFKFWVILRWMKEGCKSLSLGMPWHPKILSKNEQPTKLGGAPEWHPRILPTTIGILLEAIFLFVTWYVFCLERLVWYVSLLTLFCVLSYQSLLDTPIWEGQIMAWLVRIALYASLKFLWAMDLL